MAGDQLIVNQTGNSDGSSTLIAVTPSSNSCPTPPCYTSTATSVPNATLVAYDFSGTPFSPTFETSIFTNQYFFVLPTRATPSGPGMFLTLGGAVAAPAPNVIPTAGLLSAWSQIAMSATRDGLIVVETRVSKVIEADVHDDFIRQRVNTAATYWRNKAHISLNWDGKITSVSACASDAPQCVPSDLASPQNILAVTGEKDANEVVRRFRQPKGMDWVFVVNTSLGGFNTDAATPGDRATGKYTNVIIVSKTARDLMAHEVGHVFQLAHEPFKPFNLMYGNCPVLSRYFIPCLGFEIANSLSSAKALDDTQIKTARENALQLQ